MSADVNYVFATLDDLDRLEHAHREVDRARLMIGCAITCDSPRDSEQRQMLLDAAADAITPAFSELARTLRLLRIRLRVEREKRARQQTTRSAPLEYHPMKRQPKFHVQRHRR